MSSDDTPGPEATESGTLVGAEVDRTEDPALLTGQAKYTDDLSAPRMVHAAMARSPYGHACIGNIDTSPAEAMDGVVAVYTQADIDESEAKGTLEQLGIAPGVELPGVERPLMARDKVHYQGEAVATVLARDRYTAHQAAERVEVDYQSKESYTDPHEALEDDADPIHEEAPDNRAFAWGFGPEDAVDEAFEDAEHTVDVDLVNQRIIANPMEPRGALAQYASGDNKLRVDFGSQMPSNHRPAFADTLGLPEHKIHINTPEVGGGFGTKAAIYPDELITAWCSMQEERPVKWIATRTESYQTDGPGRGHSTHAELALDEEGVARAMRVDTKVDIGGYVSSHASTDCTGYYGTMLPGNYSIPATDVTITGVYTNKTPRDAYRGAGRPEATYVIERLMELAAEDLDLDPAEIRRRNFIEEDEFPYESSTGQVYDSGAYGKNLEKALDIIDYEEFRERQKEARKEGRYLGIGLACMVENAGAAPAEASAAGGGMMSTFIESGQVRVNRGGTVTAYAGTSDTGQGNLTTYKQIIGDELGIPVDDIEVIDGDTEHAPDGSGTMGSHSAPVGGAAMKRSAEKVFDKARRIAAYQLEAAEEDLEYSDGEFSIAGAPDRSMTFKEVARQARMGHDLPEDMEPGLEASSWYDPVNFTFSFGTHVTTVEVDPATGEVEFDRYVAVDDCGVQINPKLVEGQVHGGTAQGIGQALYEGSDYDENGTLRTASMQDYAVPKAHQIPEIETYETVTPSPHNPMGVKGVAESATLGSTPATVHAVLDALEPFGVDHIDMPLNSQKIWKAIQDAKES